jgi:drug/metabolite transporter (DMT)-like permease
MKLTGIAYMLISSLGFALVNLCVKYLDNIPVNEVVFFRSVISLGICAYFIKKQNIPFFGNNHNWLISRGIFGVTALTLFFFTIKNMPLASAVTVQYLSPIFTVIIAMFLLKEKVKPVQWLLFLVAFAGIICIKGFDERTSYLYLGLGVASALFSGFAYNSIMKCRTTDAPVTIVLYFALVATPIMGIWCLFDWKTPDGIEWALLLVIGLLTQVAQFCMAKALIMTAQSARIMPLKYVGSIYAIVIGYLIFDEQLQWLTFIGIGLVLAGIILNTLASRKGEI